MYEKIIQQADEWAREELVKYGIAGWSYETANETGSRLTDHFKVNKEVVLLGTILMDISLGKAMKQGKVDQHVEMCYKDAKEFLDKFELSREDKEKILDGVRFHHGTKKFPSLEAEIIMNTDCYKFLIPKNIVRFFELLIKVRDMDLESAIKMVKYKFNEKKKALTLEYCKRDLKENIKIIEKFLSKI